MAKCKICRKETEKNEYEYCKKCYMNPKVIKDSSIKGRLAEAIVEEMFLSMKYRVFRFGMENTIPGFGSRHLPKKGDVANEVRKMPDFVVVSPDKKINYIEVKYRTDGQFDINDHYKDKGGYPYDNAYVILITPRAILIRRASILKKGGKFMYLKDCKDFETDKEIILQYIGFCKKFFGNC